MSATTPAATMIAATPIDDFRRTMPAKNASTSQ